MALKWPFPKNPLLADKGDGWADLSDGRELKLMLDKETYYFNRRFLDYVKSSVSTQRPERGQTNTYAADADGLAYLEGGSAPRQEYNSFPGLTLRRGASCHDRLQDSGRKGLPALL